MAIGIYTDSYGKTRGESKFSLALGGGAQRRDVLLLIVSDGMKLAAIGIAIGVASAVNNKTNFVAFRGCWTNRRIDIRRRFGWRTRSGITRVLRSGEARNKGRSAGLRYATIELLLTVSRKRSVRVRSNRRLPFRIRTGVRL